MFKRIYWADPDLDPDPAAQALSVCLFLFVCLFSNLVVAPEPGQAVRVHDAEDFTVRILPADVVLVPAVRQELVDVVPQQPAVCKDPAAEQINKPLSGRS